MRIGYVAKIRKYISFLLYDWLFCLPVRKGTSFTQVKYYTLHYVLIHPKLLTEPYVKVSHHTACSDAYRGLILYNQRYKLINNILISNDKTV